MVLLDYDGTLLRKGSLDQLALRELERLGDAGVVRVLATGRSPFSLLRSLRGIPLPVDYLILSTGVGIVSAEGWRTVRSLSLGRRRLDQALSLMRELDLDFSVHHPFPENHRFAYSRSRSRRAEDLNRRLELYRGFHSELREGERLPKASQVVAISVGGSELPLFQRVRQRLQPGLAVVRTTSPLDGRSLWLELMPAGAGKGRASAWLAEMVGVPANGCLALGNDYNDEDMLDWAGRGVIMEDAPQGLLSRFESVSSPGLALEDWCRTW